MDIWQGHLRFRLGRGANATLANLLHRQAAALRFASNRGVTDSAVSRARDDAPLLPESFRIDSPTSNHFVASSPDRYRSGKFRPQKAAGLRSGGKARDSASPPALPQLDRKLGDAFSMIS